MRSAAASGRARRIGETGSDCRWQHGRVPCSAWIPLRTRPSASGSGCLATRVGACPGGDKPSGSCRAAEGYVDAQTALRTRTCDRRLVPPPDGVCSDTTLNTKCMNGLQSTAAGRKVKDDVHDAVKTIKIRSYEIGLYFRDGEFKGLLGDGPALVLRPAGQGRRSRSSRSALRGWPTRSST